MKLRSLDSTKGGWSPCKLWGSLKTLSIRELVWVIDSYVELVDLEVTSNLRAGDQPDRNIQL